MGRLTRFEEHRFVGTRDDMVVYDCDDDEEFAEVAQRIDEDHLLDVNLLSAFAPDTLAEARNRGFRVRAEMFKKRDPWGAWWLVLLTVGVYGFIWYFKINDEARRYLRDEEIKPGIAVLAITLGILLVAPPFISVYRTGGRIARMEAKAGLEARLSPGLGALGYALLQFHVVYMQGHLNQVWEQSATFAEKSLSP